MAKKKKSRGASSKEKKGDKSAGGADSKKTNTSLRLEKQTLTALKIKAIEQDTSLQNLIETLIENYLDKHK